MGDILLCGKRYVKINPTSCFISSAVIFAVIALEHSRCSLQIRSAGKPLNHLHRRGASCIKSCFAPFWGRVGIISQRKCILGKEERLGFLTSCLLHNQFAHF